MLLPRITLIIPALAAGVILSGPTKVACAQSESCQVITDPVPLNTNATSDSGWDEVPQLTTDSNGVWLALWRSRDDLGGTIGTDQDVLFARC